MTDTETMKKNAGYLAATFVQNGMTIGLGTGSTAKYFIEKIAERIQKEHLKLQAVASSVRSLEQAKIAGIPIIDINTVTSIDLTVDGADEIDGKKRMIKGGGGALLREKILASMSKEMVVIVDENKVVPLLGHHKLPVEIATFAHLVTLHHIKKLGFDATIRCDKDSSKYYITDNGNYLIDIQFPSPLQQPEKEHALIQEIPGVVETGFFFHLAGRVVIAFNDGQVIVKN
jgi:ribose 5-phosphate isomerase A